MRVVAAIVAVLGVLVTALFWVQNSSRATQLSFDAGFAAWELSQPVSVPVLVAVCFGVGLIVGAVSTWFLRAPKRTEAPPKSPDSW